MDVNSSPLEKKPPEYKQHRTWQEIEQLVVSVPQEEKKVDFVVSDLWSNYKLLSDIS